VFRLTYDFDLMTPWKKYVVKKGSDADLSAHDPDETGDFPDKEHALPQLRLQLEKLTRLQDVLYAESKHALLIVLQAMDAGGKDGTIRHVFRGMNPQGCSATAFKVPTQEELLLPAYQPRGTATPPAETTRRPASAMEGKSQRFPGTPLLVRLPGGLRGYFSTLQPAVRALVHHPRQ